MKTVYHGSQMIIESPEFGKGNLHNDYGMGFYCTESVELAKAYLLEYFMPDLDGYDAVIGYRADDSYFSFAMDFLNNAISLQQLERAMYLGKLGEQFVIKSAKAFKCLDFVKAEHADGEIYYTKRNMRDSEARENYLQGERKLTPASNDLFMIDILRQEMKQDDARLQRTVFGQRNDNSG